MRILTIANYSLLYGANRSMMTVLEYLKQKGHELLVLLPSEGPICAELKNKGIEYKVVRFYSAFLYLKFIPKHIIVPALAVIDIFMFPYLVRLSKRFNPDVVYSNTSAENIGILISKALKIKHVSHIREFMSLDHGAFFVFGRKAKKRYINMSDRVIFVSKAVADYVQMGEPLQAKHRVIFNGVSAANQEITKRPLPTEINFGVVGVLQESKGHHLAIEYFSQAVKKYPSAKLHIFGEGYGFYEKRLKSLVEQYNLHQKVIFHGFVADTNHIYQQIDVLCMFSRSEGFGRVTAEAMLRGIPVIGLNTGGTTELVENDISGYLVSDYQSFEDAVGKLFANETNYNEVRFNSYHRAKSLFSVEKYCKAVEEFITEQ